MSHAEPTTFKEWEQYLRQMRAEDLNNFFHLSFDEHRAYCTELSFLMAVADRFLELGYFSDELSLEGRKGCIGRSESVADMIRKVHRDSGDAIAAFEKAYSASQDHCKKFGFGTAAFELYRQVVDPNTHIAVVSKVDAAKAQLELAIERYHHFDWIGAVTLAGAAEECLRQDDDHDDLLSKMRDGAQARGCGNKEFVKQVNHIRNWLKHFGEKHSGKEHPRYIEVSQTDAAIMILRAMTRYHATTGEQTAVMDSFEQSFRESYPEFVEGPRE